MKIVIVIPTRNRPDLAIRAAKSILRQNDSNTELVLSDNSDPKEQAILRDLVNKTSDRIRYIRPETILPHASHWNWITKQVSGDYVGFLTDRMEWLPSSLKIIRETLQNTKPETLSYGGHGLYTGNDGRYWLQRMSYSGSLQSYSMSWASDLARKMTYYYNLPCMLNSFVSGSALEKARTIHGDEIFGHFVGDVAFSACMMDVTETGHYLDFPIFLAGNASMGIGGGLRSGILSPAVLDFVKDIQDRGGLHFAPIKEIVSNMNLRSNEYSRIFHRQTSGRLHPLDKQSYFNSLSRERETQAVSFPENAGEYLETFRKQFHLRPYANTSSLLGKLKPWLTYSQMGLALGRISKASRRSFRGFLVGPFATIETARNHEENFPAAPCRSSVKERFWT